MSGYGKKYDRRIKAGVWLVAVIAWLGSCTAGFKDINTDLSGITEGQQQADHNDLGLPLTIVQQGIYFNYDFGKGKNWPYQLMQNLSADMFSGYMHDYKPLNGGTHNSDYNLQDGWNGTFWENTYAYIFPEILRSEKQSAGRQPAFYAITKILKVQVMHRVSDYYGPVVYSNFGNASEDYRPDSQKEAYYRFFEDLDEGIDSLTRYIGLNPDAGEFKKFDMVLDGNYRSWIRFANSLRLRLAVRLAVADPEKAKTEFIKGLSQPFGVFEQPQEMMAVSTRKSFLNPLGEINKGWKEVYMNASMESILNGYKDPRRELYFEPCPADVQLKGADGKDSVTLRLKGGFHGIRQGTCFAHRLYASHSPVYTDRLSDAVLMTAAEIWFLRAEAALRKWTGEDAGECYRTGVRTSFGQWGAMGVDSYLESTRMAADFTDTYDRTNDIKARCLVSPRWDETADKELKLERIITQKWLALFPEGCEAWAEQRRTGYPRLFPVKINNSRNGCIDTEIMIRRLNFPVSLIDSDPFLYEQLKNKLGAPDHAGTRLWWDRGRNF